MLEALKVEASRRDGTRDARISHRNCMEGSTRHLDRCSSDSSNVHSKRTNYPGRFEVNEIEGANTTLKPGKSQEERGSEKRRL